MKAIREIDLFLSDYKHLNKSASGVGLTMTKVAHNYDI